jgi:hypothetical protein
MSLQAARKLVDNQPLTALKTQVEIRSAKLSPFYEVWTRSSLQKFPSFSVTFDYHIRLGYEVNVKDMNRLQVGLSFTTNQFIVYLMKRQTHREMGTQSHGSVYQIHTDRQTAEVVLGGFLFTAPGRL